eukprot:COSAG06_NODE_22508_length_721_cov_0.977492_2_plen_37_part_01
MEKLNNERAFLSFQCGELERELLARASRWAPNLPWLR